MKAKTNISPIHYLAMVILLPTILFGQNSDDKKSGIQSAFSSGVNYVSRFNYFGRVDSLQSNGMLANIGYQDKSGLYLQSNFIFVQNSALPLSYTGTALEGGFRFPQSKHFNGNIFFTDFLYKDHSVLVQSAIHYQTGVNFAYTNPVINFNVGSDLKLTNSNTDIGLTAGLDHLFLIKTPDKKLAWAINPSAYAYFGTQYFSYNSLVNKNIFGIPTGTQNVTTSYTKFNVLSIEFSAPIVLVAGKFNANFTPSFVIPKNMIPGEIAKETFYFSTGIGIRL